jgi:tetratricopeptide (TPR) repeat protein
VNARRVGIFHPKVFSSVRAWALGALLIALLDAGAGCDQVSGRRLIQKGNQQFHEGQYAAAVATFREAEQHLPGAWQLWLNKGTACRQMMVPGGKTKENEDAVQCALDSFTRMRELRPQDQRGPALYVQTLFDAERYDVLAAMYRERAARDPADEEAVNGLIQVYARWTGHTSDALIWYEKKADLKDKDAEAQYAVGVYVWQQLFAKGGGADKAGFDPRLQPGQQAGPPSGHRPGHDKAPPPPSFAADDIFGQKRVDLADVGLKYLDRAVALRPNYTEAMAYLNLLWRQRSFAFFDQPAEWQKSVDKATEWRDKMAVAVGKPAAPAAAGGNAATNPGPETTPASNPAN